MATKAKNDMASVLAFEKKIVPSDGYFYGTTWDKRNSEALPLKLREKSVRGTISNRLKKALQDDPMKLDAKVENANLQTVDSCALAVDQDTLKLHFTLKILSGIAQPSACNNENFYESYVNAINSYINEEGFKNLARRYAINIASGRFLWRNRVGAEQIEVVVKLTETESLIFNALSFDIKDFDSDKNKSDDIDKLANEIANALSGKQPFALFEISAYAQVGQAQDVYPSEELVLDKTNSKNKKSKILYHIEEVAGMHSQKIGNAIRTIDTWYPEYQEVNIGPIAIEPYGAVTNLGKAYRNPKAKADFFTLFDKFARGIKLENKNDEHYVMAVLVRGGVFGASKD